MITSINPRGKNGILHITWHWQWQVIFCVTWYDDSGTID